MSWIQLHSGQKYDLAYPDPSAIDPVDLAISLSRLCRFAGHCTEFYSVAQHSVLVCDLVVDADLRLPALLHDAHEALWGFGDICRPAKQLDRHVAEFLDAYGKAHDATIGERFGFDWTLMHHSVIKQADLKALAIEANQLMHEPPEPWGALDGLGELPDDRICALSPGVAADLFLERLRNVWK